jgi:hypothetical protein
MVYAVLLEVTFQKTELGEVCTHVAIILVLKVRRK